MSSTWLLYLDNEVYIITYYVILNNMIVEDEYETDGCVCDCLHVDDGQLSFNPVECTNYQVVS
jgi:hypothetical protein